jgi:response regulator RpfG family c-di-GMP phosphodiesterase
MQTQDDLLIFIVDDNFIYNNLIASQLRSNKFQKIESFLSGTECLKNLYKKPDIVIQDYLISELIGNDIQIESKKRNLDTEFVFLSGLDNFSKVCDQNTKLFSLSGSDKFNVSADSIKYGPHDHVVKDLIALEKLILKFNKKKNKRQFKKQIQIGFNLFSIAVATFFLNRPVLQ